MTTPNTPFSQPKPRKSGLATASILVLVGFALVAGLGITSRAKEEKALAERTNQSAIPTVAVMPAPAASATEEVVLPGTIQAWHEAIIYARTGGYLKMWNVDIGAHVKAGDVLAEIDAPDLDAQYHQAQADLKTAEANNDLAQITAKRWVELLKTNSVSKQDTDTKVAAAAASQAEVNSAQANLDHLQQQEDFKKVVAPFDGIITQRNTDIGALVIGQNNGTGQDLFHIAQLDKLRVYVQVPENDVAAVQPDMIAELHLPQKPQQVYSAKLTRTADALDPTTRSLTIELEVDNSDESLIPGGYVDAHLKLPTSQGTVILPANALLFREHISAVLVKDNKVEIRPITIGRDYGKTVEVVSGINPGDTIIVNPPDSILDGQSVSPVPLSSPDKPAH